MDQDLLEKLKSWRKIVADREGIDLFRVFPNKTIESIAALKPRIKDDLLSIKGIKERKFEKYGREILALINDEDIDAKDFNPDKPYTVSNYLNLLNSKLREQRARVQGEISGLDIKENYLFFSLKDKEDESVLSCFMWTRDYELCGVSLEEGVEIIVEGFPEIYKPNGRFSLRISTVELVGEGALKKAYDDLKKKLEREGLFSPERKKTIPKFPQKIGLITSKTGDVIYDFLNNLGKYGYQTKFMDSRVEGQSAVRDLVSAMDYFGDKDIDLLVIIRGGGSLESLQAFNNEVLVRKITEMRIPVICGIGHEKDVSLASLAADLMVSTPTAVTIVLNKSWEGVLIDLEIFGRDIVNKYQIVIAERKYRIETLARDLRQGLDFLFKKFSLVNQQLGNKMVKLKYALKEVGEKLSHYTNLIFDKLKNDINYSINYLKNAEERIVVADPKRQLKLGYSIASVNGKIVKSVRQVNSGDQFDVQVFDGKIRSQVKDIINK